MADKLTNNPPDVILPLSMPQAQFLLRNCNSNITLALGLVMRPECDEGSARKLVEMMEQFKEIRTLLQKEGVDE